MAESKPQEIEDWREGTAVNIRRIRKAQQMKQQTLADKTGINQSTISKIEKRGYPLSMTTLYKISHVLGVAIAEILPTSSPDAVAELP